jgi:hypothetical protein
METTFLKICTHTHNSNDSVWGCTTFLVTNDLNKWDARLCGKLPVFVQYSQWQKCSFVAVTTLLQQCLWMTAMSFEFYFEN